VITAVDSNILLDVLTGDTRHGSAGEDRLASALEGALKSPWVIYRNVAWLEKRPGDEPADAQGAAA